MKKTAIIVLTLVILVGVSSGALAGRWGRGYGGGAFAQQLTEEQRTKLREIRASFMQDTLELRQSMATKGQELRTLMVQKDFDQTKAKALAYELVDLRSQLAKKFIDQAIQVKTELGIDLPMGGFGGKRGKFGRGMGMGPRGGGYGYGMHSGGYGRGYHSGGNW